MKKKIKGSLSKPEPSLIIAAAALSLCVLLPMRVYHVTALIDSETGFFTKSSFTIPLFYTVLGLVTAAAVVLSYLNNKANRARDLRVRSNPLGIVSAVTAATILADAVVQMFNYFQLKGSYDPFLEVTQSQYMTKSGATALLCQAIFGVFSACFFGIYAISCFNKNSKMRGYRILSVSPVLWAICRIIARFVRKISFVNVSDLLLELFMLVFLITFLLAFSQIVTNVTPEVAAWRLFGCGIPAALIAFLVSIPRVFLIVIGHSDSLVAQHGFTPCDLAFALFIPVFLYNTATAKTERQ